MYTNYACSSLCCCFCKHTHTHKHTMSCIKHISFKSRFGCFLYALLPFMEFFVRIYSGTVLGSQRIQTINRAAKKITPKKKADYGAVQDRQLTATWHVKVLTDVPNYFHRCKKKKKIWDTQSTNVN